MNKQRKDDLIRDYNQIKIDNNKQIITKDKDLNVGFASGNQLQKHQENKPNIRGIELDPLNSYKENYPQVAKSLYPNENQHPINNLNITVDKQINIQNNTTELTEEELKEINSISLHDITDNGNHENFEN